jgi:hypothetical protein
MWGPVLETGGGTSYGSPSIASCGNLSVEQEARINEFFAAMEGEAVSLDERLIVHAGKERNLRGLYCCTVGSFPLEGSRFMSVEKY